MEWLRRHAWQLLFGMTSLIAFIGLNPVKEGIHEDPSIPLAFTGMTPDQLQSDNAQTFRLVDVQARFSGIDLIVIGILFSTILATGFRRNERWAWWAMWLLPIWGAAVSATILRQGLVEGQAPPSPLFTGPTHCGPVGGAAPDHGAAVLRPVSASRDRRGSCPSALIPTPREPSARILGLGGHTGRGRLPEAPPEPGYHAGVSAIEPEQSWRGPVATVLVGIATAIVVVSVAIVPFLSSPWLAFEQGRAESAAWTGFSEAEVAQVTNAIVEDLVVGPADFDVAVGEAPVLNDRERGHMRDVRTVFVGLWILTGAALIVLGLAALLDRPRFWRGVRRGAAVLAMGVVVLGVVALVAFDTLFETFHRLLFAGGSYTFDTSTDRLVQLFPFVFWQETAMAVGAVIVGLSALLWWIAGDRERAAHRAAATGSSANPAPESI